MARAVELSQNHHESVEYYKRISWKLRARGFDLLDTSDGSIFGRSCHVTDEQADNAADAMPEDLSRPSGAHVDMFLGSSAVEQVLRNLFLESFSQMEDEREEFTDQANEARFDAASIDRVQAGEMTLR